MLTNIIGLCGIAGVSGTVSSQPSDADPHQLQLQSYKLVGDNIDKSVKARYMRSEGGHNKSLHYFLYFAGVDFSAYPDVRPLHSPMQIGLYLLPSTDDDITLHLFMTHLSCIYAPIFPSSNLPLKMVEWCIDTMASHKPHPKHRRLLLAPLDIPYVDS